MDTHQLIDGNRPNRLIACWCADLVYIRDAHEHRRNFRGADVASMNSKPPHNVQQKCQASLPGKLLVSSIAGTVMLTTN